MLISKELTEREIDHAQRTTGGDMVFIGGIGSASFFLDFVCCFVLEGQSVHTKPNGDIVLLSASTSLSNNDFVHWCPMVHCTFNDGDEKKPAGKSCMFALKSKKEKEKEKGGCIERLSF